MSWRLGVPGLSDVHLLDAAPVVGSIRVSLVNTGGGYRQTHCN
jgi:hypothetical protein